MSYTALTELHPAYCNLADAMESYAQPEQIGINTDRIERVARWAGFHADRLTIRAVNGETSSYSPSIVGIDSDGTAIAGAGKAVTVDPSTASVDKKDPNWRVRTGASIAINMSEMHDRVQDTGSLREPANWAKHIDRALAQGLRKAAYKNLASRPFPKTEVSGVVWMLPWSSAVGMLVDLAHDRLSVGTAASSVGVGMVATSLMFNMNRFFGSPLLSPSKEDVLFSIVPIVALDRLAAVSGLTRTLRLAKAGTFSSP